MKPYGATTEDYGDTGCCPGHDQPMIVKWSGYYGARWRKSTLPKLKKFWNRIRRHEDKRKLKEEVRSLFN